MVECFVLQKELIREVEMGPFKHTLDDGLDIRKVSCQRPSFITFVVVSDLEAKDLKFFRILN